LERVERLVIRGGRVLDPSTGTDAVVDLYAAGGNIVSLGPPPDGFVADTVIDATGRIVAPGLVDLCAHTREPGQEHKGTIASETRAAARGGITTVCCPPDTDPVVDTPAVAELIRSRAEKAAYAHVVVIGALTRGLGGKHLSEMGALKAAGCVGVGQGSQPLADTLVLRRALEYAATHDLTVFLQPQDFWLSQHGCVHEGEMSMRLGLAGIPESAETVALARDLVLVEQTGVRAHFCRLSCARSVDMVRCAKSRGLPVTADVSAHQLHLTELDVAQFNSACHVRPPLRSLADREALRAGAADGTLCAICSDHQPHEPDAKCAPFPSTEPGISGLETLLPLTLKLVHQGTLTLADAIARLTHLPASVLGLRCSSLTPGCPADICVIDPEHRWRLDSETFASAGKNTPFAGWEMIGKVELTLLGQTIVYGASPAQIRA
jgi:dihydroorotase